MYYSTGNTLIFKLEFDGYFSYKIINTIMLYDNIIFSDCYDNVTDNLPNNISSIRFGTYFNKSINYLPNNLMYLVLGKNFQKRIDNLPNSLISIRIDSIIYKHSIRNLPKLLIKITINVKYNKLILPSNNCVIIQTDLFSKSHATNIMNHFKMILFYSNPQSKYITNSIKINYNNNLKKYYLMLINNNVNLAKILLAVHHYNIDNDITNAITYYQMLDNEYKNKSLAEYLLMESHDFYDIFSLEIKTLIENNIKYDYI